MKHVRLLSQDKILQEWWAEVKENFWADTKSQTLKLVKELMESSIHEDLEMYTKEQYDRKIEQHKLYRNGYYQRGLVTQFGTINDIHVPRLRQASFKTKAFKRYHRYQDIVEDLILDIFLAGVSTRRVGQAVSKLLDTKVSHSTVSRITRRLDSKVKQFHNQELLDEYQYLFLDAITLKIKHNNKYTNRKVFAAYGITLFGQRKLIAFRQFKHESYESWLNFLDDLYKRGLKGRSLKLITTDGAKGLHAAIDMVYFFVPRQPCWAHKLRNVSNYLKKIYQEDCIKQASRIYKAKSKQDALNQYRDWRKVWIKRTPKAVACLDRDIDNLLNFYDCPKAHWKKVRTTNVIERSFREVRRRTRVFSCFANLASSSRIIYAIFAHLNNQWKEHPLKDFTQFS